MASSASIAIGNTLFKYCFPLYKITYQLFKKKQDAFEISLMKKHIKQGDTVLDIGANIGFYAELFSDLVGVNGKVHCFEPDTTNFKHLNNRCANKLNVTINNKAVAHKTEIIKIYTSKLLNVDHRTYEPDHYDEVIEIDAVSIDEYLLSTAGSTSTGKKVNFIKMDIQGFEMNAIQGMVKTLENSDVKILSEFWPYGLKKAGSSITQYYEFLTHLGFTIYLIKNNQLLELTLEEVTSFLDLPESNYMNIFATKNRV